MIYSNLVCVASGRASGVKALTNYSAKYCCTEWKDKGQAESDY